MLKQMLYFDFLDILSYWVNIILNKVVKWGFDIIHIVASFLFLISEQLQQCYCSQRFRDAGQIHARCGLKGLWFFSRVNRCWGVGWPILPCTSKARNIPTCSYLRDPIPGSIAIT